MARGDPEVRIRLPADVKEWIATEARRELRSQTAQIIILLQEAKAAQEDAAQK